MKNVSAYIIYVLHFILCVISSLYIRTMSSHMTYRHIYCAGYTISYVPSCKLLFGYGRSPPVSLTHIYALASNCFTFTAGILRALHTHEVYTYIYLSRKTSLPRVYTLYTRAKLLVWDMCYWCELNSPKHDVRVLTTEKPPVAAFCAN